MQSNPYDFAVGEVHSTEGSAPRIVAGNGSAPLTTSDLNVEIAPPDPDAAVTLRIHRIPPNKPGFLRRQRELWAMQKAWTAQEPDAVDRMVSFLLKYCPIDYDGPIPPDGTRASAITDAILSLSAEEFKAIMDALAESEVNPPSDAS